MDDHGKPVVCKEGTEGNFRRGLLPGEKNKAKSESSNSLLSVREGGGREILTLFKE